MIWIFMIAFIIMGISNLLINSKALINEYDNKKFVTILENNSNNIINKLDTSNLSVWTEFYVYKDSSLKEFVIFTWATNEE